MTESRDWKLRRITERKIFRMLAEYEARPTYIIETFENEKVERGTRMQ